MPLMPPSPPQSDADDTTGRPRKKQKNASRTERLAVRFDTLAGVSSEAWDAEGDRHKPAQRPEQDVTSDTPPRQSRSSRVRSCDACRIRKNKCDRGRPCANCTLRRARCTYENAGNDPFSGTRLQQNNADIARLCERVFMLAGRLGLSEGELDGLAATADMLDEDDAASVSSDSPPARRKRPLSELLRDRDASLRSETPAVKIHHALPPSSWTALPPKSPSPRTSPEHGRTATPRFAYTHVPAFAGHSSNVIFAPFPPSPHQVIHYVPYLAPSSSSLVSLSPHSLSPPQPTFLLRPTTEPHVLSVPVHAQPPTGFSHPAPLPGWSTTTSLASTASAQRACPVLLPPITIPPTLPSRPSASPCALRSTSEILTTPSTAASPCPAGDGFGSLPPPPRGGYHLPRPKRTAGAPGVGLSLERFASAAGVTTTGRVPSGGALCNVDALEGLSAALPPLRYPSIRAAASDLQKKALGKVDQDAARVKLPRLSQAVSAALMGSGES
ncbi:hypothetical protein JCM3770_001480 [Rhodotorula araucariae]